MSVNTKNGIILSNAEFLNRFTKLHHKKPARPFCWVLGTGASISSGVPMGRELTERWLSEMYDAKFRTKKTKPSIQEWADKEFKNKIPGFEYERATNLYPFIYQQRYAANPEQGISFIEGILEKAKPNLGYKALAQMLTFTAHKVAITTNFDNLISAAVTLFTNKEPLVTGHELLTKPVIRSLRRPIVAKIHRDLFLAPQQTPNEIAHLSVEWKKPLTEIFKHYTPIIVGFGDKGGSGGSLMRFLEGVPPIEGGIYWCYREKKDVPPVKEIQSIVKRHKGHLVPIVGFDELMFQLWDALKLTTGLNEFQEKCDALLNGYQGAFHDFADGIIALKKGTDNSETLSSTIISAEAALKRVSEESI
jgi:hypothetical protein